MDKPIVSMVDTSLQRIKEMIDVNMIIGDAINTADGTTIIPVSKVSLGFGSGGSEFSSKQVNAPNPNFGGGVGSGLHITPVAFLIVQNGNVRLLPVDQGGATPLDRVAELAPAVIDKISSLFSKNKNEE